MSFVEDAIKFHAEKNGMLAVASKVPLRNREDLSLAYTPGVAEPCKAIKENKELSFEYTCRGNTVAIGWWNPGQRYYCSCCGRPFLFDDDPPDKAETTTKEEP